MAIPSDAICEVDEWTVPVTPGADRWLAERTDDPRVNQIRADREPPEIFWEVTIIVSTFRARWFSDAIEADQSGDTETALDIAFDHFDRLLVSGDYPTVDYLLQKTPKGVSLTFLMGLLSITLPAYDKLRSRDALLREAEQLARDNGRDIERLLGGLRQWSRNGPSLPEQQ